MALSKKIQSRQKRYGNKRKRRQYLVFLFVVALIFAGYYFSNDWEKTSKAISDVGAVVNKEVSEVVEKKPTISKEATQSEIETSLASVRGTFGYYVIDLKTGESFGKNEDYSFTAASSIKVPFAVYVYSLVDKGTLAADKTWTYTSADYETGTGNLIASPYGTKLTIAKTIQLMIRVSDNAATNMVTRYLGYKNIQAYLDGLGFAGINVVQNKMTPKAAATVLQGLYKNEYLSKASSDIVIDHMKNSITPTRIVAGVPDSIVVAHKIGTGVGAISDTAIVYHPKGAYVLTVYSDKAIGEDEPTKAIANISRIVYKHFDSR